MAKSKMILRPTRKVCMGMGGATLAILLSSVGVWFWQSGDLEAKAKIVAKKHDEVEHGERVANRLEQVRTEHEQTARKLSYLESAVAGKTYVPTMLKQIANMAGEEKLKVLTFTPKSEPAPPPPTNPEEKKKWKPQPYDKEHADMQVEGTFWSVTRFINRLTRFQKIVAVNSLRIEPKDAVAGTSPRLTVAIKLTGFAFLSNGPQTGAVEASPLLGNGAGTARRRLESQIMNEGSPRK